MVRSILSRYDADAELRKAAGELGAVTLPGGPQITETHRRTVDVLGRLLDLGAQFTGEDTPQAMRVLVTLLQRSRPALVEGVAKIPPSEIVSFIRALRDELNTIIETHPGAPAAMMDGQTTIDEHLGGSDDEHEGGADHARPDQPSQS